MSSARAFRVCFGPRATSPSPLTCQQAADSTGRSATGVRTCAHKSSGLSPFHSRRQGGLLPSSPFYCSRPGSRLLQRPPHRRCLSRTSPRGQFCLYGATFSAHLANPPPSHKGLASQSARPSQTARQGLASQHARQRMHSRTARPSPTGRQGRGAGLQDPARPSELACPDGLGEQGVGLSLGMSGREMGPSPEAAAVMLSFMEGIEEGHLTGHRVDAGEMLAVVHSASSPEADGGGPMPQGPASSSASSLPTAPPDSRSPNDRKVLPHALDELPHSLEQLTHDLEELPHALEPMRHDREELPHALEEFPHARLTAGLAGAEQEHIGTALTSFGSGVTRRHGATEGRKLGATCARDRVAGAHADLVPLSHEDILMGHGGSLSAVAVEGLGRGEWLGRVEGDRGSGAPAAVPGLQEQSPPAWQWLLRGVASRWPSWLPPLWTRQDSRILELAGPTLLALAADPLLSLVDTAYVGRLGSTPLAALGVDTAVFSFSFVIFSFLATATTPLVASALASGDRGKSGRTIAQALALAALMGVAVMVGLECGADSALNLMGADSSSDLHDLALAYLRLRALAAPAVLLSTVGQGAFRGLQDTTMPLLITTAANVINFVLDPILIFGLGWGVTGAGAATAVAEWASATGYCYLMWQHRLELGLTGENVLPAFDWRRRREAVTEFEPFLFAGGAVLLRSLLLLATKAFASAVATRTGNVEIAAHQVGAQLWLLSSLLVDSLAVAGQALVAVDLGAGNLHEARATSDRLLQFGVALGIVLGALYAVVAPALASVFTDDAAVLAAVDTILPLVVFMQPLNAVVFTLDGLFVGASDFQYLAVAMFIATGASAAALIAVEPCGWGLPGVWWSLFLLMFGRAATLSVRYNSSGGPIPPTPTKASRED